MAGQRSVSVPGRLELTRLRNDLMRLEETIIFALIERAQFALNPCIYSTSDKHLVTLGQVQANEGWSLLEHFLCETEKLHARLNRYSSPEENTFFPQIVEKCLENSETLSSPGKAARETVLHANSINVNNRILNFYVNVLVKKLTANTETSDDREYGASSLCDIAALQALSKRIHYGKFIAESKYLSQSNQFNALISSTDVDGIMALITDSKVEEQLLQRVRLKASTYGQEIGASQTSHPSYSVSPDLIVEIYREFIIPLTKEVELEYLVNRLGGPRIAVMGHTEGVCYRAGDSWKQRTGGGYRGSVEFVCMQGVGRVIREVLSGMADFGVIPYDGMGMGEVSGNLCAETAAHLVSVEPADLAICGNSVVEEGLVLAGWNRSINQDMPKNSSGVTKVFVEEPVSSSQWQTCVQFVNDWVLQSNQGKTWDVICEQVTVGVEAAYLCCATAGSFCIVREGIVRQRGMDVLTELGPVGRGKVIRCLIVCKAAQMNAWASACFWMRPTSHGCGVERTFIRFDLLPEHEGNLTACLNALIRCSVKLRYIQSFPVTRRADAGLLEHRDCMLVEIDGHIADEHVKLAMKELHSNIGYIEGVVGLGSYTRSI